MKFIFFLLLFPFLSISQVFTIDDNYIEFSDTCSVNNFSANTYLNTLADVSISYEILLDSSLIVLYYSYVIRLLFLE